MICKDAREKLVEYYYKELPRDAEDSVSQHLEQCRSCRDCYNELSDMLSTIRLQEPMLPERFWTDLDKEVFSRIDMKNKSIFLFRPVPAFIAVLLLIAVVFGGGRYFNSKQTQDYIAENYELLHDLELYENLEFFEHMDEIELLEKV